MGENYLKEYGFKSVFLFPVNLYGPGDNFIAENAHVIPSLIQRFIEIKKRIKLIFQFGEQVLPPENSFIFLMQLKEWFWQQKNWKILRY